MLISYKDPVTGEVREISTIKGDPGPQGPPGLDATLTKESIQTALGFAPAKQFDISQLNTDLNAKQDKINDLSAIRSGASLGATALQSHQDISGKQDVLTDSDKQSIVKTGMTSGAAWTAEEQANARSRISATHDVFSYDEIDTGKKWIDGKTIYKKAVSFGNLPASSSKTVSINLENGYDTIVSISGIAQNSVFVFPIPLPSPSSPIILYASPHATSIDISIETTSNRASLIGYIYIEYTK